MKTYTNHGNEGHNRNQLLNDNYSAFQLDDQMTMKSSWVQTSTVYHIWYAQLRVRTCTHTYVRLMLARSSCKLHTYQA